MEFVNSSSKLQEPTCLRVCLPCTGTADAPRPSVVRPSVVCLTLTWALVVELEHLIDCGILLAVLLLVLR